MFYQILASAVVLIHFAFVIFVIFGGFLVLRWRWLSWLHLPAVIWGALIEFAGWICPLTPLENQFRMRSGTAGYEAGFIEHYLLPIIYPEGLTRSLQIKLGIIVIIINVSIYGFLLYKKYKSR